MPIPLNIRPLEVDPENPHANDALDREIDCLMLTDLIGESGGPFTLAVDAEWGNGKTVFIRMLEAHLAKRGFRCVSFNAWECDFCDEPLAPLIAEIGGQASENSPTLKKIKTEGNKLYECFKKVVAAAHPAAGAVVESVEELAGGEETGGYDFMTPYEEYRSALERFRECMQTFSLNEGNGKPLVVLIDDLDRCRPDFAVKTLERMKHIFNIPSLVFVMAVNERELAEVVRSFYGCGDGEKYLEKFFDLVFHLRNEKTLIGVSMRETATGRLLDRVRPWPSEQATLQEELHLKWFAHYLDSLSRTFGFSLRVQQKLVRTLCVVLMTVRRFDTWYDVFSVPGFFDVRSHTALGYPLICYFLALRVANPDLFHRSVESEAVETFPWEEHIRFYLYKLGVEKSLDTDADIDLHLLNPVNSKKGMLQSQDRTVDVLETVRPDRRNLICLSLVALASSWSDVFSPRRIRDWDSIAEATGAIKEILHARIKDYGSFREFLKAIDFAGKFYEPGNENS